MPSKLEDFAKQSNLFEDPRWKATYSLFEPHAKPFVSCSQFSGVLHIRIPEEYAKTGKSITIVLTMNRADTEEELDKWAEVTWPTYKDNPELKEMLDRVLKPVTMN